MEEKLERITDEMIITEWRSMLSIFKEIIKDNPPVSKVKEDLEELAESAKLSARLTPKQRDGIYERCQSYINGTYGKGLSHEKSN
jgi:hypothetical protein